VLRIKTERQIKNKIKELNIEYEAVRSSYAYRRRINQEIAVLKWVLDLEDEFTFKNFSTQGRPAPVEIERYYKKKFGLI
jgi:hypothetical protein